MSSAESTKPTVTQMVLVNPAGLQNKMNRPAWHSERDCYGGVMDGRVISDWVRMRGIHRESCKISKRIKRNLASKYKYFITSKTELIKNFTLIKMSNNILRYNSEKSLGKNTKKIYIKYLFMEKPHFCFPQDTMWLSTTHFLNTKSIQRNVHTHTQAGRRASGQEAIVIDRHGEAKVLYLRDTF